MAGIAGGNFAENTGGAKILPIKIFDWKWNPLFQYWELVASTGLIPAAIDYSVEMGANIINMSFGLGSVGNVYPPLLNSIEAAFDDAYNNHNILLVAAAGNEGWSNTISYPAFSDYVIAVGATDQNDDETDFSNNGNELELAAPGVDILTLDDYSTTYTEGTSFSSPMVAATASLMLSVKPDLYNTEIREILKNTAEKVGGHSYNQDGWNKYLGYGRINTYYAVCAVLELLDPIIISTSNLWDEPVFSLHDIVVETGNTLTITSTVYIGNNAKFIIEPGANVILDGGTLTNYKFCGHEDNLWLGVEVWGNEEKSQLIDPSDNIQWQGKLIMKNGATIENAEYGVLLSARDNSPDGYDDDKNGGIVTISNGGDPESPDAYFLNNKKSVVFRSYDNFNPVNPSIPMGNISQFRNCHFEVNSGYLAGGWYYTHIYALEVNGVYIAGCTFENNKTTTPSGHGINAWAAGFRVVAICNSMISPCPSAYLDKCTFTNFKKAINNLYSGSRTVYVSDVDFFNNSYGVMLNDVDNATIIFSNFNIGYNDKESEGCDGVAISRGIDISNSVGFKIEENDFTKATGVPAGDYMGIRINESHTQYDLIYLNTFENLNYGNYAEGMNRQNPWDDRDGLEYQCNYHSGNEVDFIVTDEPGNNPQIRTFQGLSSKAAGNEFSSTATMHFQNDGTQVIDYFYVNQTGQVPIYYTPYYVQPILVTTANGCPSNYGGGSVRDDRGLVLSDEERQEQEELYAQNLSDYNNVNALYENLKDGGNTETLQSEIELSWPDDMWELRAALLGNSPHLSKEVLMTAADKTDVLPDAVLFEILSANPDELRKEELITYLEDKENPLPEYMIAILRELAGGITYKTILQQQMAKYSANQAQVAYKIIRSILHEEEMDFGDLRNWLDNLGGIRADEQIINSYIAEGNFLDATALLDMIPSLYGLEGEELTNYSDYATMINLLITLKQEDRSITECTETEKTILINLADNGNGKGRSMARGILNFAYGYEYCDCPQPGGMPGTKSSKAGIEDFQNTFGAKVSAEPNPAGEWTVFKYELPQNETSGAIKITDVSARIIEVLEISGQTGQKVWDTRNIKNGVYFYTITSNGVTSTGKIVVNK